MDNPYGLGLGQEENRLAAYQPGWAEAFAHEAARIRAALGPAVLAVEHYGSTSIPGLPAKPIIDLLIGVRDLAVAKANAPKMFALGYDDRTRNVVPGHYIMGLGVARTHHAHFVAYEGDQWWPPLIFRDRLRADPALRDEYAALKRQLAAEFPNDRAAYTTAKSAFVARVLASPA
jgi:GrpB-like predicted nucleotidyltransferase (UPF0157 family)